MILVLGGTSDSLVIAEKLAAAEIPFFLSVTSDYGQHLAEEVAARVIKGRLTAAEMTEFIRDNQITALVDATHPFAVVASKTAIAVSQTAGIDYLRFERPSLLPEDVITVDSLEAACEKALAYEGKIYLTTGSKTLPQVVKLLPKERLVARVLPTAEVLTITESIGLAADQIEGLKGPFSKEMNIALMQHNQAAVLLTKESGQAGGFLEKVAACHELKVPCIVIQRERLAYPAQFSEIEGLVAAAKESQKQV